MTEEHPRQALEALFLTHRARLLNFLRHAGAGGDAEDLLQEAWFRLSTAMDAGTQVNEPLSYLGHPFNPPHLIPLVEVVGGQLMSDSAVEKALIFYASVGKKPVRLHGEMKGLVANRREAALWRECIYLVDQGVVSVSDIGIAIAHGSYRVTHLAGALVTVAAGNGFVRQVLRAGNCRHGGRSRLSRSGPV